MPRGDRGGTCTGIGSRCVAANCGNQNVGGFSLHTFPKDKVLRKQWVSFVRTKRASWDGPSETSVLCSFHFTEDSFPFRQRFEKQHMGKKLKKTSLNRDAVPTIHAPVRASSVDSSTKRSNESPIASTSKCSPPKKVRGGYLKREVARVCNLYLNN